MGRKWCGKGKGVVNKGSWAVWEDEVLAKYVKMHGEGDWRHVPQRAGLNRCGKSCRLRWVNYLRPDVKRGNISHDEDDLILRLHRLLGNKWSIIAARLPGRTDNEIKNYWNTNLSKRIPDQSRPHAKAHHDNDVDHPHSPNEDTTNHVAPALNDAVSNHNQLEYHHHEVIRPQPYKCTKPYIGRDYCSKQHSAAMKSTSSSVLDENFDDDYHGGGGEYSEEHVSAAELSAAHVTVVRPKAFHCTRVSVPSHLDHDPTVGRTCSSAAQHDLDTYINDVLINGGDGMMCVADVGDRNHVHEYINDPSSSLNFFGNNDGTEFGDFGVENNWRVCDDPIYEANYVDDELNLVSACLDSNVNDDLWWFT